MHGIFGNENGTPLLLKWDHGHFKPVVQLALRQKQIGGSNGIRCVMLHSHRRYEWLGPGELTSLAVSMVVLRHRPVAALQWRTLLAFFAIIIFLIARVCAAA
jgi:hypothetical protein